jgi:hypothetical protein
MAISLVSDELWSIIELTSGAVAMGAAVVA